MTRTIKQTKAIKRQGQGFRWFSIAGWCRDMYVITGEISYLHEYHHSMALSMFHYRAARILLGAEPTRVGGSFAFEVDIIVEAVL